MILSDVDIRKELQKKDEHGLVVDSLCKDSIQPASIDLRLGREFSLIEPPKDKEDRRKAIDIFAEEKYTFFDNKERFTIYPKKFVLATTLEWVSIPDNMTAFLEGRSSIGRKGLFIHNAGYIDPGFKGNITLELFNCSERPIVLESGMRICQLVISRLSSPAENPYNGKYQHQDGVTPSRISRKDR